MRFVLKCPRRVLGDFHPLRALLHRTPRPPSWTDATLPTRRDGFLRSARALGRCLHQAMPGYYESIAPKPKPLAGAPATPPVSSLHSGLTAGAPVRTNSLTEMNRARAAADERAAFWAAVYTQALPLEITPYVGDILYAIDSLGRNPARVPPLHALSLRQGIEELGAKKSEWCATAPYARPPFRLTRLPPFRNSLKNQTHTHRFSNHPVAARLFQAYCDALCVAGCARADVPPFHFTSFDANDYVRLRHAPSHLLSKQ